MNLERGYICPEGIAYDVLHELLKCNWQVLLQSDEIGTLTSIKFVPAPLQARQTTFSTVLVIMCGGF